MPGYKDVTLDQIRKAMPQEVPAGVAAIIRNYFDREPISFNTDWSGTMAMWGLTMWAKRGVPGCWEYVKAWFEAHMARDPKMTDEEFFKTYTGHKSRVIRGKYLPFTMYCGLFGTNYPLSELYEQFKDEKAKQTCIDIADAILYRGKRNQYGIAGHDDHWEYDIPDACFFTVEPLMRAAKVEPDRGWPYVKLAVAQLRAYIDQFLDRKLGLSKTIMGPKGVGVTYWGRAQGWLMWAMIGVLRGLSPTDPAFKGFRDDLEFFADGVVKTVDKDGSIHAFANWPDSDQETTGTAMVCLSLHEAMRKGWLPKEKYSAIVQKMWDFCRKHITDDGGFEKVYVEWALPAELGVESSKTVKFGPHIGALLWLADELTTK